jgi:hypothetical protein
LRLNFPATGDWDMADFRFHSDSSDKNQRRIPEEKGPFGKARKRGTSRAKTPTANSAADLAREINSKAIDNIFSAFKPSQDNARSQRATSGPIAALPPSASAPNLIDVGGLGASFAAGASTTAPREPKEVILYGYGADVQWAVVSHFERVSNGLIYEEYDREPFNSRSGVSFGAFSRSTSYSALLKSTLRRVNEYVGGDHWIKVTFDSAEAAERACHYSPHVIQGYSVFAEPYRGTGPTGGDRAIFASVNGAPSEVTSPETLSSGTLGVRGASQASTAMSSTTVTAPDSAPTGLLPRSQTVPLFSRTGAFPPEPEITRIRGPESMSKPPGLSPHDLSSTTTAITPRNPRATLRLKGTNVKPAIFLPQEKAFLPAAPRWQQTVGSLPIIGWVIGSGTGIIGYQVPRKEDGSFDAEKASLYWRAWYTVDTCFGTDFCGVKEAEYDE